ncbi:hypothetical protein HETIRDRAFT_410591 [Heterobasidion irregulare TC 32-1]|uniref:Secreted protein n=1 Tax=Heterobasidion irregulare (strain TC 32-1) TaxID=747525 RepID=W4K4C2_HETIT|nr:uncharacterized protein HETIRDRAFT_410591 [Heterobasidion irregulare TC 32-1]ETW80190.1 hypothetical protein HETIRDRAFT_410591 [Heterobasidion irregulare TC 32-1]
MHSLKVISARILALLCSIIAPDPPIDRLGDWQRRHLARSGSFKPGSARIPSAILRTRVVPREIPSPGPHLRHRHCLLRALLSQYSGRGMQEQAVGGTRRRASMPCTLSYLRACPHDQRAHLSSQ